MQAWLTLSLSHLEEQGEPFGNTSAHHEPVWRAQSTLDKRRGTYQGLAGLLLLTNAGRATEDGVGWLRECH